MGACVGLTPLPRRKCATKYCEPPQDLLTRVLRRGFHHTAGRLVGAGLAEVSIDTLEGQVPKETLAWIMKRRLELDLRRSAAAGGAGGGGGGGGGASKHGALCV